MVVTSERKFYKFKCVHLSFKVLTSDYKYTANKLFIFSSLILYSAHQLFYRYRLTSKINQLNMYRAYYKFCTMTFLDNRSDGIFVTRKHCNSSGLISCCADKSSSICWSRLPCRFQDEYKWSSLMCKFLRRVSCSDGETSSTEDTHNLSLHGMVLVTKLQRSAVGLIYLNWRMLWRILYWKALSWIHFEFLFSKYVVTLILLRYSVIVLHKGVSLFLIKLNSESVNYVQLYITMFCIQFVEFPLYMFNI